MGVSVMTGLGSGDLSIGLSSSLSWWIQRSGGFRSLELPLYLWEPLEDLEAARFLRERKEKKSVLGAREERRRGRSRSASLFLLGRGAPRAQEGPHHHQNDGEGPHGDDDDDDQDVVLAGAGFP